MGSFFPSVCIVGVEKSGNRSIDYGAAFPSLSLGAIEIAPSISMQSQQRRELQSLFSSLRLERGKLPRLLEYCRRLCQWAQKVKPGKLACFEAKNGAVAAISQKCLLRPAWRGISGLHFCLSKNFCTLPLERDIGPRSRKRPIFGISRNFVLALIGRQEEPSGLPVAGNSNHQT